MQDAGQRTAHRGIVVSDLHLFARRSRGAARFENLREALTQVEVLVLNGDIFDFRWSTVGDGDRTVAAALDWLGMLAAGLPDCEIHYTVGNHDCTAAFKQGLASLADALPKFHWNEYLFRLGSRLFVHGDCAQRRMNHDGLIRFRNRWQRDWQWNPAMARAYECVDRLGITKRVHQLHFPRRRTVGRIAYYLDSSHPGWRETTRDCYFGHTHLPFADYTHDGIRFHNTGSAIHHLGFNPIRFEVTHEAA